MSIIPKKQITISGHYWDSYLYDGCLYLWTANNEIVIINWSSLLFDYEGDFISLDEKDLYKYHYSHINNPLNEYPADIGIHNNIMYAVLDQGLIQQGIQDNSFTEINRLWDAPLYSLKIKKNGRVALSAGHNGLFEYDVYEHLRTINKKNNLYHVDEGIFKLSDKHSLFANWNFSSIYSSSNKGQSFIASFNSRKNGDFVYFNNYSEGEIFGNNNSVFSWGAGNKIYRTANYGIEYVTYTQKKLTKEESPFSRIKEIPFLPQKGKIIYAGAASFGVIIECEKALVVKAFNNEDSYYNIMEPITKWRVYTNDVNYHKYLTVILDDRIEVLQF